MHYVVTYPNQPGSHFDFDYYVNTHLPLGARLLKNYGFVGWSVERGIPDIRGMPPAFHAITRLYFNDKQAMRAGFAAHGEELGADLRNYTDVDAVFTLAEPAGEETLQT
jgi:uncharacterized protein (TIGR02118 family)